MIITIDDSNFNYHPFPQIIQMILYREVAILLNEGLKETEDDPGINPYLVLWPNNAEFNWRQSM